MIGKLFGIAARPSTRRPTDDDALDLLLACHGRIRSFTSLAVTLAGGRGLADAEVAEAAGAVARYFGVALPLHVADEDESLMPRLLAAPAARALDEPLRTMEREHVEIEAHLAAFVPVWEELAAEPGRLESRRGAFGALPAFERLILSHLEGARHLPVGANAARAGRDGGAEGRAPRAPAAGVETAAAVGDAAHFGS
jgi:hypothetical protein